MAILPPDSHLPLYGKRILITAPRRYAARLSAAILVQGGLPILTPTIETCTLAATPDLDIALKQAAYQWIAFTSRTGIQAVWQRLERLGIDPVLALQRCRVCAIGQDAEYLKSLGIEVDIIPAEPSPTGILAELGQVSGLKTQTILVPKPLVEGVPEPNVIPNFLTGLAQLNFTILPVSAYLTRSLKAETYSVELSWIRQGIVDAIAFSSTAEISALLQMMDATTLMNHCVIACLGPYSARNAENLGLSVDIVSQDFSSFTGFAEAIAQFFAPVPQPRQDPVILP